MIQCDTRHLFKSTPIGNSAFTFSQIMFAKSIAYLGGIVIGMLCSISSPVNADSFFEVDGLGHEGEGAGATVGFINANERPDLLLMAYDSPQGANTFKYKIGFDLNSEGKARRWSGTLRTAGVGHSGSGAGAVLIDINRRSGIDVVFMALEAEDGRPRKYKYKIGLDLNTRGEAREWSGTIEIPCNCDDFGEAAGADAKDLDGNGIPELVLMYHGGRSVNSIFYSVGWNINRQGIAQRWTHSRGLRGMGNESAGAGLALTRGSMIIMSYDDPRGPNTFQIKRFDQPTAAGPSEQHLTHVESSHTPGVGNEADGAGLVVTQLDDDARIDVILMAYDDPRGQNTFKYRTQLNVGWQLREPEDVCEQIGRSNFNNDRFDDLAVGAPNECIGCRNPEGRAPEDGVVHVFKGSRSGIVTRGSIFLNTKGMGEPRFMEFGVALASGDFNGDCHSDLAVGAGRLGPAGVQGAASVLVYLGNDAGIAQEHTYFVHQDVEGVAGKAEAYDRFGQALATGDFNGDGIDDLAVGIPNEDLEFNSGEIKDAGAIQVFYSHLGTPLALQRDQVYHLNTRGIRGIAQEDSQFGQALYTGDFNGDGFADLIGVYRKNPATEKHQSGINILFGSRDGLQTTGSWNKLFEHPRPLKQRGPRPRYRPFGLAVGRFNADRIDDFVVTTANVEPTGNDHTDDDIIGGVQFFYGGDTDIRAGSTVSALTLNMPRKPRAIGSSQLEGIFAGPLIAGDFDGDGLDDLAVNDERQPPGQSPGAVARILYTKASGIRASETQFVFSDGTIHPGNHDPERLSANARVNSASTAKSTGDYNGDGFDELVLGMPGFTVDQVSPDSADQGSILIFRGSSSGLKPSEKFISQDSRGVPGSVDNYDRFGAEVN